MCDALLVVLLVVLIVGFGALALVLGGVGQGRWW